MPTLCPNSGRTPYIYNVAGGEFLYRKIKNILGNLVLNIMEKDCIILGSVVCSLKKWEWPNRPLGSGGGFCLHICICNSLFDPGLILSQRCVIYHEELEGHEGWDCQLNV